MGNKWSATPSFTSDVIDEDEPPDKPPDDDGSLGTLTVTLLDSKNFSPSQIESKSGDGGSMHTLLRVCSSFSSHVYTKPVKYQQKNGTTEWHMPTKKFAFAVSPAITTEQGSVKLSLLRNNLPPLPAVPVPAQAKDNLCDCGRRSSKTETICQITFPVSVEDLKTQKHTERWVDIESDGSIAAGQCIPQVRIALDYTARTTRVLKVGQTINDKYDIDSTIGSGQSVVKKAKNKQNCKEYAIKFLSKQAKAGQKLAKSAIEKEIEMMRSIYHPNIVQLSESVESVDMVYLVMELVKGSDLYDVIQTLGSVRPTLAGAIISQILSAVAYLHSRGIAHHDIKPENVIVDYLANKVKLTDFGSAKEVKNMTGVAGTLNYMAPEILMNMRGANIQYDQSIDIWSIGVLAYVMLSGVNPFEHSVKAHNNIMNRIISGKYDFASPQWDNVPKHCKDFIKKCLVVEPKRRATAVELLKHPWISSSVSNSQNCFTKKDQEKLEQENNSQNSSRSNSMQSLLELFNCPSRS